MGKTPEGIVKQSICEYLSTIPDCFFWVQATQGTFDPTKGRFRKNNGKYNKNGVADILGIFRGSPLAIEVKSKTGYPNDNQKKFLEEFRFYGGISFIARSVEDVEHGLFPERFNAVNGA